MLNIDVTYTELAIVWVKGFALAILIKRILLYRCTLLAYLFGTHDRQLEILKITICLTLGLCWEVEFVGMGVRVIEVVHVGELDIFKLHEVEMDHGFRWTIISWHFRRIIMPKRLTRFNAESIRFQIIIGRWACVIDLLGPEGFIGVQSLLRYFDRVIVIVFIELLALTFAKRAIVIWGDYLGRLGKIFEF